MDMNEVNYKCLCVIIKPWYKLYLALTNLNELTSLKDPVDTWSRLNVEKTFIQHPVSSDALCMFNLGHVSTGEELSQVVAVEI